MFGFNGSDARLLINLFKMTIRDRYLGSSLGSFWAISNPLFMLSLYTYVFGYVFKIKLPGAETTLAYVVWLISGYGPWIALQESIMASTTSVIGSSGLVKNLSFKTELLPIAGAMVGVINLAVSMSFLFLLLLWSGSSLSFNLFLLPLVMFVQFLFAAALGIWLSVIAVFVRDVIQALPTVLTAFMFMTPIFYPYESMPEIIQLFSIANPLYQIVDAYRMIVIEQSLPNLLGVFYVFAISVFFLYFGLKAFRRAKGSFESLV